MRKSKSLDIFLFVISTLIDFVRMQFHIFFQIKFKNKTKIVIE